MKFSPKWELYIVEKSEPGAMEATTMIHGQQESFSVYMTFKKEMYCAPVFILPQMGKSKIKDLDTLNLTSKATPLPYEASDLAEPAKSSARELIATRSGTYLKLLSQAAVTAWCGQIQFLQQML